MEFAAVGVLGGALLAMAVPVRDPFSVDGAVLNREIGRDAVGQVLQDAIAALTPSNGSERRDLCGAGPAWPAPPDSHIPTAPAATGNIFKTLHGSAKRPCITERLKFLRAVYQGTASAVPWSLGISSLPPLGVLSGK
jgi:hypothetical protein